MRVCDAGEALEAEVVDHASKLAREVSLLNARLLQLACVDAHASEAGKGGEAPEPGGDAHAPEAGANTAKICTSPAFRLGSELPA